MRRCLARLYHFISKGNRFRKIRTKMHQGRHNVPIFGLPIIQAGVLYPEPPGPQTNSNKDHPDNCPVQWSLKDIIGNLSGNATERNDLKPSRLESVDILRGLAIAMMVFTHFFNYTINSHLISSKLIFATNDLASYLCVPLFYFIVGYTLVISLNEKRRKGHSEKELTKYILVRSSLLYVFGFILNIYSVGFDHVWQWETLQMIAIGYLVTYYLLKRPKTFRMGLIVVILMIAFMLAPFYDTYRYLGTWNITGFFLGFIFSGEYPFLPWIAYFLLGSIFAEEKDTMKIHIMTFIPLIFFSLFPIFVSGYIPIDKYPASLTYSVIFISVTLITYFGVFWIYEIKKLGKIIFYPLRIFGMYSLTIFVFHYILLMELIKLLPISYSLDFVEFLGLFAIVFIIFTSLGIFWDKWKFKYSLDWFLKSATHEMLNNKKIMPKYSILVRILNKF